MIIWPTLLSFHQKFFFCHWNHSKRGNVIRIFHIRQKFYISDAIFSVHRTRTIPIWQTKPPFLNHRKTCPGPNVVKSCRKPQILTTGWLKYTEELIKWSFWQLNKPKLLRLSAYNSSHCQPMTKLNGFASSRNNLWPLRGAGTLYKCV